MEIWLQLIFLLTLKSMLSVTEGLGKRRTWWGMWKWTGNPFASIRDQSGPKFTPTLFANYHMPEKRSLDWDLFCGGSSARLPSTSHVHKMNSHPGIIIYATSHCKLIAKDAIITNCVDFWNILYFIGCLEWLILVHFPFHNNI